MLSSRLPLAGPYGELAEHVRSGGRRLAAPLSKRWGSGQWRSRTPRRKSSKALAISEASQHVGERTMGT